MIAAYLRIKSNEEKFLKEISNELNQQRISLGKQVLKPSEVLHELIDLAIKNAKVEEGELKIK